MTKRANGWRLAGLLVMTLATAHCGDGDNHDHGEPAFVSPGTYVGSTSAGGAFRLEAGSIEAVAFDCDGTNVQERFSPPAPIDADGDFDVRFSDAGRGFHVRGRFSGDAVGGTIDDEDDDCDVAFEASLGDRTATPTPLGTFGPTNVTATRTPTSTVTGPTATTTGATPTPTLTPSPIITDGAEKCPVAVEVLGNGGSQKVLDSGWTGLAHNATVVSDGKLTFTLSSCEGAGRPCGVCDVGGPIQNQKADQGDIDPRRCTNDTAKKCAAASECSGGTCEFFFGAPLPLSAGGISTCVVNQVSGNVSGTANIESGAFQTSLNLISKVYNQISVDQPCPQCNGDGPNANDGTLGGTCNGGARNGQPCDVNGKSPVTAFGSTSLDCPPAGSPLTALQIALSGSSGTETKTLSTSSPNCQVPAGTKCFCPYTAGQPTSPNACLDDTNTSGVVEACGPVAGSTTKGECTFLQVDPVCSPFETFRSCGSNADCTAPGDACVTVQRPCYLDNGKIGGSVTAIGMADPPVNGTAHPTFASLFCVGNVAQPSVNAAAGLPGLGRVQLPLVTKEIPAP